MEKESEFKQLEKHVERLLESYAGIKAENKRLESDLLKQKEDNEKLVREIETLESDKGEVSSRVGSLINKIESWEAELKSGVDVVETPSGYEYARDETVPGDDLGENGDEDERAGGVQTSLFTGESTTTS